MERTIKKLLIFSIIFFIRSIKNIFSIPNGVCRFQPTCTKYVEITLNNYPFHRACILIIIRVIRCNPLSKGGYDPVPKYEEQKE